MFLFLLSLLPILTLWFLQHQVIKEAQTLDTQKVIACLVSSVNSCPRCTQRLGIHFIFIYFFKIFLIWTILKSLLIFFFFLQYCFCCVFWFSDHETCGILASLPEIKLTSPAMQDKVLTLDSLGSPWVYVLNSLGLGSV